MDEHDRLAATFEENRTHLRAIAFRMLGSACDADDAVQEAWLRLSQADADEVENMPAWLTTVTARVCLVFPLLYLAPVVTAGILIANS